MILIRYTYRHTSCCNPLWYYEMERYSECLFLMRYQLTFLNFMNKCQFFKYHSTYKHTDVYEKKGTCGNYAVLFIFYLWLLLFPNHVCVVGLYLDLLCYPLDIHSIQLGITTFLITSFAVYSIIRFVHVYVCYCVCMWMRQLVTLLVTLLANCNIWK